MPVRFSRIAVPSYISGRPRRRPQSQTTFAAAGSPSFWPRIASSRRTRDARS